MEKIIVYIFILLLTQSCQINNGGETGDQNEVKDTKEIIAKEKNIAPFDLEHHLEKYEKLKASISQHKISIKNRRDLNEDAKLELAESYISEVLIDSIFEYWLGTPWDFNGHTEKPRGGEVACGYFVSTTIRDVGVNINRYKVAQKAAADIIMELCDNRIIKRLTSFAKLEEYLQSVDENELLIVGLDNHVGFLYKKNGLNYFAHSNYINRKGVEVEITKKSIALKNSSIYVIGSFSKNKSIIRNWLNRE